MSDFPDDARRAAEHRLAVYGTLAPGRENHGMLAPLAGVWTEGVIRGRRVAAGWGNTYGFPAVQLDPAGEDVPVAVFESPELPAHWATLDAFEGDEYERVIADVRSGERTVLAYVYAAAAPRERVSEGTEPLGSD